jgi:hypothetical protein
VIEIVIADFSWVESANRTFDAVLFTSSFHYASDHLWLMRARDRVLTLTGGFFFGSEPTDDNLPPAYHRHSAGY